MLSRIEICGPMGVGKATLARVLSIHGRFTPVFENADNPFKA